MKGLIQLLTTILGSIFSKDREPLVVKPKKEEPKMLKGYKIVIDPGHGGKNGRPDPGAVGSYKGSPLYERDVVLKIGIELAIILENLGMSVILTRVDNSIKSDLKNKVDIVKQESPDLFISIHANANAGTPAQGIETFYNKNKPKSVKLAKCVQDSLMSNFSNHRNRGTKDGSRFYVLRKHDVEACCLIEAEFINNPNQAVFLAEDYRKIAEAISEGVKTYLL